MGILVYGIYICYRHMTSHYLPVQAIKCDNDKESAGVGQNRSRRRREKCITP